MAIGWSPEDDENVSATLAYLDKQDADAKEMRQAARQPPKRLPEVKRRFPEWRLTNSLMAYRLDKRISQAELAAKVGVTRATISAIENRKHEPRLSLALAIAEVLEMPVDKIFKLQRPQFAKYDKRR